MNNEILPGLTLNAAKLLAQLAMGGLQALNNQAMSAGKALEAAIKATETANAASDDVSTDSQQPQE